MTRAARRRSRSRLVLAAVFAAVVALVASACSDGHTDVRQNAAIGWSSYGGGPANARFTGAQVPGDLALTWQRDLGGRLTAPLVINGSGDVAATIANARGCNFEVFDQRAGRKNYCKRLTDGSQNNAALFDQIGQPYIGQAGMFFAFNGGGAIRWRYATYGVPLSAAFAGPGRVLVATSQGQMLLLDSQTGDLAAPELLLRPDTSTDPSAGFADCTVGGPKCAVSAPPALDPTTHRVFVNVFPQDARTSQVRALTWVDGDGAEKFADLWTADVGGGVMGPPTVSIDGKTVYATGRDGHLYALDAATGRTKWSHDIGGHGFASLSVAPDGTLVPAGTLGGPLLILHDDGDSVTEVARRTDVRTAGVGTLTGEGTLWTVVRGDDGLTLDEFDATTGQTKRTLPLPQADGFSTGVAVSAWGTIAVGTSNGQIYFFGPAA